MLGIAMLNPSYKLIVRMGGLALHSQSTKPQSGKSLVKTRPYNLNRTPSRYAAASG
ncbi:hypothetical protein FGKAn22_02870 [Ferrigenium kumadai]|uniref:Uncharacterized protein n=1 Tax=Ferrigenium kumadai TaxID=1682490 RepID=A0AAN1SZF0_9PROT|nr:hypothetical protein FGKAn22_02870 [Ferrigenium kumadai]